MAAEWNAAHPLRLDDIEFEAKVRALFLAALGLWRPDAKTKEGTGGYGEEAGEE